MIHALKHQSAYVNMVRMHPEIPYNFLIGGYGCGKSFSDVLMLTYLTHEYRYCKEPITFGMLGVTIKLLKQTVIADFERFLDQGGIPYKDNTQAGTITIGNLTFVYLPMQDPDDIYAHNFHGALIDEIDEVPTEKVQPIVTAVQERCRKVVPAGRTMAARKPFICFSTTAQGLGGTYQLVKSFDKANLDAKARGLPPPLPYALIRGRTEDNPNIDPDQVVRLRALYTEEEAAAYLDGKFMNLSVGRVWYSFDRRKHVCMRFPVLPTDTVYWGQDFNLGINACCICVVRANVIYVVASYHWQDMAEGAMRMRAMYPANHIVMIPDASGKEIMQGFAEEFDSKNVEIVWNSKNPGIHERVMAGNILFRQSRLLVMEDDGQHGDVDNAILTLEGHDVDEKTGKPRKGTGMHAPDHFSDSISYAVWRIIHTIEGYNDVLTALRPSTTLY